MGPLPFSLPGAAYSGGAYRRQRRTRRCSNEAIAMIPEGDSVVVSTANNAGAVLSERRVVYSWPYIDDADWVIVDQTRPFVLDEEDRGAARPGARQAAGLEQRTTRTSTRATGCWSSSGADVVVRRRSADAGDVPVARRYTLALAGRRR